MNKEEILKKAQNRNPDNLDEMELYILYKGSRVGMYVALIACLVFMIIRFIKGMPYQDIYSAYSCALCGEALYSWFKLKDKKALFGGICWGITAVMSCIWYFALL